MVNGTPGWALNAITGVFRERQTMKTACQEGRERFEDVLLPLETDKGPRTTSAGRGEDT